ncbi:MAG: branched-chain amino acid ABC transporter ATP-binding protein/permease [Actinobacteria bacterium]|nr:branched-chain amino acid ABC transporter ATP-binding protein/permease [Actinomycetota bacterium]
MTSRQGAVAEGTSAAGTEHVPLDAVDGVTGNGHNDGDLGRVEHYVAELRAERARRSADPVVKSRRYARGQLVVLAVILVFPWLPFTSFSVLGRANLAGQYALIATALVVLTGWVGQVSLGHAAFVGIGAYVTGIANEAWGLDFPFNAFAGAVCGALLASLLGMVALRVRGLYLAVATLIFSWTADAFLFQQEFLTKHSSIVLDPIGKPGGYPYLDFTSRRTYYYLIWAVVGAAIIFMTSLRDRKIGRAFFAIRGSEMAAASLGIDVVRTKLVAFAISGTIAGLAGGMLMVGAQVVTTDQFNTGQSLFFLAIAVVGGLTSLPGAVAAGVFFAALEEVFFRVPSIGAYLQLVSAFLLAAVLLLYPGGLAAIGRAFGERIVDFSDHHVRPRVGPVLRRLLPWRRSDPLEPPDPETKEERGVAEVTGRPRRSTRVDTETPEASVIEVGGATRPRRQLPPIVEGLVSRLQAPIERFRANRMAQRQVRDSRQVIDFAAALRPPEEPEEEPEQEVAVDLEADDDEALMAWETLKLADPDLPASTRDDRRPLIEVDGVVVRFGGLTAVNDFSMKVCEGEIVGLIGPNGAGKTTSFNSIAGFNTPAEGTVKLYGLDVTNFPVHLRSRLGVARTFQAIQLFPQLDVFDNLLVATYLADQSGLFGSMFLTGTSLFQEYESRRRVREVIELLGLEDVAHRSVADLPFGVLRMVEIARALVTGAPLMMLDEPASGLDDTETERLAQLVRFIRSLGVTILLIEHDVKMVTGVSDYMYVLDQGTPIAQGTPDEIKRNPAVIAAYLGESPDDVEESA